MSDPTEPNDGDARPKGLGPLVADFARINCALWHEEDAARCDDDLAVARAKRKIDALNQRRNDTIEKIDQLVLEWSWDRGATMAETVGSLIDKLTIVELRRWHTEEAMLNPRAAVDVRHAAALRLHVIDEQRNDLAGELDRLWHDIVQGRVRPKIYRQLKMYNDAAMREATQNNSPKALSDCDRRALSQPEPAQLTRTKVLTLRRSTR